MDELAVHQRHEVLEPAQEAFANRWRFGVSYLAQGLCTSPGNTRTSNAIQRTVGL